MRISGSTNYPQGIDILRESPRMFFSKGDAFRLLLQNIIEASSNVSTENLLELKELGKKTQRYVQRYPNISKKLRSIEKACNEEPINIKKINNLAMQALELVES